MARLEGKVAVVTGAAQGMGAAIAEAMLAEGARVLLFDVEAEPLAQTSTRLAAAAPADAVRHVAGDVSQRADVRRAFAGAVEAWGPVHVVAAQAGIAGVLAFDEIDDRSWQRMLDVNLGGAFLTLQEGARAMTEGGSIVVTASTNAWFVEAHTAHYSATKGGVRTLVRAAAIDLAQRGIRVNVIHPGIIRTRLSEIVVDDPVAGPEFLKKVPLARFGQPEDVARAAVFLASDDASYITGADLVVDGGVTLGVNLGVEDAELGSAREPA